METKTRARSGAQTARDWNAGSNDILMKSTLIILIFRGINFYFQNCEAAQTYNMNDEMLDLKLTF